MHELEAATQAALLKGLSAEHRRELSTVARTVDLAEGEYLFHVGGEAKDIFIVSSGIVELVLPVDVARERQPVVVEEVSAGETVGWSAFAPPYKYTRDARVAKDAVLFAIDREALETLCEVVPALGRDVMRNLVGTMGHRLRVLHAMWVRELRRNVEHESTAAQ